MNRGEEGKFFSFFFCWTRRKGERVLSLGGRKEEGVAPGGRRGDQLPPLEPRGVRDWGRPSVGLIDVR